MNYYKTENEIITFLEYGSVNERQKAMTSIIFLPKGRQKELYSEIWNIFISDENIDIRKQALSMACSQHPEKIPEIIKYIQEQKHIIQEKYFIEEVGNSLRYDNYSKNSEHKFYESCIDAIGNILIRKVQYFENKKRIKELMKELCS